jgi:hypothetical protein
LDAFAGFISDLIHLLIRIGASLAAGLEAVEISLRDQLTIMGVSPPVQTVILVLTAVVLILLAVRLFGGLIRFAVIVILLLLALDLILPAVMHGYQ